MLTRHVLGELLPDDQTTVALAERISGLNLSTDTVSKALKWMAEFTESDRLSGFGKLRPEWRDRYPSENWWNIEATGLSFKPSWRYLTAEGWPMATTCWVVFVECGFRECVTAESPELAVLRAICFIGAVVRWRETEPTQRKDYLKVLAEMRELVQC